jgi:hypothetical protein
MVGRGVAVTALALSVLGAAPAWAQGAEPRAYPALRAVRDLGSTSGGAPVMAIDGYPQLREPLGLAFPSPGSMRAARRYAASRRGRVSFAVADSRGGIRGRALTRSYRSASLAKALLLAARLQRSGRRISRAESEALEAMIRVSDNDSADAVYRRLGPVPVRELAGRAGMRSFSIGTRWQDARVTAADQARFFLSLDRLLPARRPRAYARSLLASVAPQHSWGIPAAARRHGWRVFFKGGWRPENGAELVHQAGLLERGRRRVAVAVLTNGSPSESYGRQTVRGIALRLLRSAAPPPRAHRAAWPGALVPLRALARFRAPEPKLLHPLAAASGK